MPETRLLVQLVRIAIGRQESFDRIPDEQEWRAIYKEAKKHAILGVCCRGMMLLPKEQMPEMTLKVRMGFLADEIRARNTSVNSHIIEICGWLKDLGLDSCVLKGQGFALFYPDPGMRTPGDIDIWVNADVRTTLRALKTRWQLNRVFYHHTDIHPFDDGTEVEIHFHPSWMNGFISDRRLRNYIGNTVGEQFGRKECCWGFVTPSVEFDCVVCAVHILRHLLAEGIGLKQILDYYHILLHSSSEERQHALVILQSLQMDRFLGALMYVEKSLFLLDDEYLLCQPDAEWGEFLLDEIFIAGNFGKYDSRHHYNPNESIIKRAFSRLTRLVRYFGIAPGEVLWAPVFKVWQHLWRYWIKMTH